MIRQDVPFASELAPIDAPAVVTIISAGKAVLPQRQSGHAIDRIAQLTDLLSALTGPGHAIDALSYRKALEARSANTVKALANDLACYAAFCRSQAGPGLPASASRMVAYCEHLEALGIKPATAARRLTSLSVIHGLLGVTSPVREPVVRDTMAGYRRRQGTRQRQAGALRLGPGIGAALALRSEDEAAGEGGQAGRATFTLTALLAACDTGPPGLRDAALLSLGYDTGLRVAELVRVAVEHIKQAEDGSGAGTLFIPTSKTDQTGQGAHAWISAESMRRIAAWGQDIERAQIYAKCRRLQSYQCLLANSLISCSRYLPLAGSVLLELSASVLAIIRRCLQTGRCAHAPSQWVLQTRRRQALL